MNPVYTGTYCNYQLVDYWYLHAHCHVLLYSTVPVVPYSTNTYFVRLLSVFCPSLLLGVIPTGSSYRTSVQ